MPNVRLAGRIVEVRTRLDRVVRVPFDFRGYPIFDNFVAFDTRIPASIRARSRRTPHFIAATEQLTEAIRRGEVPRGNFTPQQCAAIRNPRSLRYRGRIPEFTWHHHQDGGGRMQLVPRDIHEAVRHVGDMAMRRGR